MKAKNTKSGRKAVKNTAQLFPATKQPQRVRPIVHDADTGLRGVVLSKSVGGGLWKVQFDGKSKASLIDPDQLSKKNPGKKRFGARVAAKKKNTGFVDSEGRFRPIRGTEGADHYPRTRLGGVKASHARDRDKEYRRLLSSKGKKAAAAFLKKTSLKNPQTSLTAPQLAHLRREFAKLDNVNLAAHRGKFQEVFAGVRTPLLRQLAKAKIEWVSPLAENALMRRMRNPATKKNLHPLEVAANSAVILGGLDHLWTMMSRTKKKKAKARKKNTEVANPDSQYVEAYLRGNAQRGFGRGLTVSSFLSYNLSGSARKYSDKYATALFNALYRGQARGEVIKGKSAGGALAYYPRGSFVGPTKNPRKKNLGLISLVENLQAAEYLGKRLAKKKKNPVETARAQIRREFLGQDSSGKTFNLLTPPGPKAAAALGKLVTIKLANGREQTFANGSAWLCAVKAGGKRRLVIGLKQPFAVPNGLDANKAHDYGEVAQLEYLARKPHLYGEASPEYRFFHKLGEEGGSRPHLILHHGCLALRGGDYDIKREGISD
jgi:hypothetical protein